MFKRITAISLACVRSTCFHFCAVTVTLVAGCNGNDMVTACKGAYLDVNCCPVPDSAAMQWPEARIEKINVFLEASQSMIGYMPKGMPATGFQKVVPTIVTELNEAAGTVDLYTIPETNDRFVPFDAATFRDYIQNGLFTWSMHTFLPAMLDSLSKYADGQTVNILISDCIYSPDSNNKKNISLTSVDVRKAIYLQADSLSTTVYCLKSDFRGSKYREPNSPYYIIVQGRPENLHFVEKQLVESFNRSNQSWYEVNFGLKYPVPAYTVLPYTDKTANFIANACDSAQQVFASIQHIKLNDPADSLKCWLALDLKAFPPHVLTPEYLKKNLVISAEGARAGIIEAGTRKPDIQDAHDRKLAARYSHFVQVKITDIQDKTSELRLSLKYERPDWIDRLNEPEKEGNRKKTLGLNAMVKGFEEAYKNKGQDYYFSDVRIALIKE